MSLNELSPKPQAIHDYLPATVGEISSEFDVQRSTVRDHLSSINDAVGLNKQKTDGETLYSPVRKDSVDPDDHELPPSKQAVTKKANRHLLKLERRLAEILEGVEPLTVTKAPGGDEDVAIHRTDSHLGSVVEDEFGREVFNEEVS